MATVQVTVGRRTRGGIPAADMALQRRESSGIGSMERGNNWRRTAVRIPPGGRSAQAARPWLQNRRGATLDLLMGQRGLGASDSEDNSDWETEGSAAATSGNGPVDLSFFKLQVVKLLPQAPVAATAAAARGAGANTDAGTASSEERQVDESRFAFGSDSDEDDDDDDGRSRERRVTVDYELEGLVGSTYNVGPSGLSLGTAKDCDVRFPKSSGVQANHARLAWRRSKSISDGQQQQQQPDGAPRGREFDFEDLSGCGRFELRCEHGHEMTVGSADAVGEEGETREMVGGGEVTELRWDTAFTLGRLLLRVVRLAPARLVSACLFAAVRNGDVAVLAAVMEAAKVSGGLKGTGESCPLLRQTSVQSAKRLNLEICEPVLCNSLAEDDDHGDVASPFATASRPPRRNRGNRASYRRRTATAQRYLRMYRQSISSTTVGLLHVAVEMSNPDIVTLLLEEGAEVNSVRASTQAGPLHAAVAKDRVEIARILLRYGASTEIADSAGRLPFQSAVSHKMRRLLLSVTLLCSAAPEGDADEVQRLLDCGTPANGIGLGNKNALHFACIAGNFAIATQLIMAGADVNLKGGSRQRTPLHYAALSGSVEVAQCLIDAGAKESTHDQLGYVALNLTLNAEMCRLLNTQSPSLCIAAQGGDVTEARRLLENENLGAEDRLDLVNQRNEHHHAAIHLACVAGNIDLIQLLLQHSASVDLPGGSELWTPLMFASMAGQVEAVEYLLSIGTDQMLLCTTGHTVQDLVEDALAKVKEEEKACVNELMSSPQATRDLSSTSQPSTMLSPPLISRQTSHQNTSEQRQWLQQRRERLESVLGVLRSGSQRLQQALNHDDLATAQSLLENGVVTASCAFDHPLQGSALYHACALGRKEFASLLLDHGASLLTTGEDGLMPAHVAASNGHLGTLELLLERGQDVQARESQGSNTLLHVASVFNRPAAVELLLRRGAERASLNNDEKTAFDIAKQFNVQRLLAVGSQRLIVEARLGSVTRVRSLLESDDGVSKEEMLALGAESSTGVNPLHEAARLNHQDVVEALAEAGCNVNATAGVRRETVLHVAAGRGLCDLASYLMDHGARVDIKNWLGQTPFEVARNNAMRKLLVQTKRVIHVQALPDLNDDIPDDKRCRVCMDNAINTIILPCGHQAFCSECAAKLTECALDRQPINEIVKVFC